MTRVAAFHKSIPAYSFGVSQLKELLCLTSPNYQAFAYNPKRVRLIHA